MPVWSDDAGQAVRTVDCPAAGQTTSLRWRNAFRGHPAELSQLRRWLEVVLPPCAARDDIGAVAHELSLNAVVHTASGPDGWFIVDLTWAAPAVRVAVGDGGAPLGPRIVEDPGSEHGRGLLMVRGLSARMGVYGDEHGRVVWADVPWPSMAPRQQQHA